MSFKPYPKYKESGVEWLGRVPEHWEVIRLKHCARLITAKAESRSNPLALENIESWTGRLIPSEGDYQGEGTAFGSGDILFGKLRPYLAKVHLADRPGEAVGDFHVLRPEHSLDGRFAQYGMLTREFIGIVDGSTYGSKMPRASWEFVGGMPMAVPPSIEQPGIATFLDHETVKIDALIAEQQRLIELLQEKRQAVISHSVTKGLNPGVPTKPSDCQWTGHIPQHWQGIQLGRVCRDVADGPHFSPKYVDQGVLFLSARNIKADCWDFTDVKYVSEDDCREFDKRIVPELGDVLFTKGGTTGIARVVDLTERFQVWVHVAVLKLHKEVADPEYIAFSLNSTGAYEQSQLFTRGATNQDLGLTRMIRIRIALPPISEQRDIVKVLHAATRRLDAMITEGNKTISLLQERRSALISAAVTGQIDVRGFAGGTEAA